MEAHYLEPRIFGGVGGNSVADTKTPVFPFVIGWGAMERISEGTRHVPSESLHFICACFFANFARKCLYCLG